MIEPLLVKPADLTSLLIINFDKGFRGMDEFEACLNRQFQLQGIRQSRDYNCRKEDLDENDSDGLLKLMKKANKEEMTLVIAIKFSSWKILKMEQVTDPNLLFKAY